MAYYSNGSCSRAPHAASCALPTVPPQQDAPTHALQSDRSRAMLQGAGTSPACPCCSAVAFTGPQQASIDATGGTEAPYAAPPAAGCAADAINTSRPPAASSAVTEGARVTTRFLGYFRVWRGSGKVFDAVDLWLPDVRFDTQVGAAACHCVVHVRCLCLIASRISACAQRTGMKKVFVVARVFTCAARLRAVDAVSPGRPHQCPSMFWV